MEIKTKEEFKQFMEDIINFYKLRYKLGVVAYYLNEQFNGKDYREEKNVKEVLLNLLDYLHYHLRRFEIEEEFEICALIKQVIDIKILQLENFLKRRNCYKEEYKQIFQDINKQLRNKWAVNAL